jgi:superfamily II DNA or RNA helicase
MVGQRMNIVLERILDSMYYGNLDEWQMPNLDKFSNKINLFTYQAKALENITKTLYVAFGNTEKPAKTAILEKYRELEFNENEFAIDRYKSQSDTENNIVDKRFKFFRDYFDEAQSQIPAKHFLNRACFWMATGSGKSVVLIKTIELLDYLQNKKLIPKKEIMLLLPREDLIKRFKQETDEFNKNREKPIELVNMQNYEEDKQDNKMFNGIKVYYYRSDLLRDERKENILNYRSYDNDGNWYIFLDEAHRGEKEDSWMQNYVTVLSRNGFLFNFSATFTESIDYVTTCFNFNLEKFIEQGYGKNLYLSKTYFTFKDSKDELNEREKQKQVLKSLILFTLIKKSKSQNSYHNPLLITLVNSVNTKDADLLMFFKKIEEIAIGNINATIFGEAKQELEKEFSIDTKYIFGKETLKLNTSDIQNINIEDLLKMAFNSKTHGKIELQEGEKGKEIVLKLETSDIPFALIKIGEAKDFQKKQLGDNYREVSSFDNKNYFEKLNEIDNSINFLLGSRAFYEGWDSNRPNVINMINIGGKEAKKFALQAIGRGTRIEPQHGKGKRQRLPYGDENKNTLLETLFIFATDKKSIKEIIEKLDEQKSKEQELNDCALQINDPKFYLLVPMYTEKENIGNNYAKFNISQNSLYKFRNYIKEFKENLLLLKHDIALKDLSILLEKINDDSFFQNFESNNYEDMDFLFGKMRNHIFNKNKFVEGVRMLDEEDIIHFKHIKISGLNKNDIKTLSDAINKVIAYQNLSDREIKQKLINDEINMAEAAKLKMSKAEEEFEANNQKIIVAKLVNHYYIPLIYSKQEKIDYINHIIVNKSEVDFVKKLENYLTKNALAFEWMFSKIDETIDKNMGMPYFYKRDNRYREFFPDFIFWLKKDNEYKIIFVDPKGVSHTDYENKVCDFEKLFLDDTGQTRKFKYNGLNNITFDLMLFTDDLNTVNGNYVKYWHSNVGDIFI